MISIKSLNGYILEEAIARLLSGAGYRLLTRREDDPHDLDYFGNGLQVRGRGGFHQADVLGELAWTPAFGNPIRLFIEAKWHSYNQRNSVTKVGIPEVRQAVGITQDINQVLSTVQVRDLNGPRIPPGRYAYDFIGRGFCYTYRYALFSTSGFSKPAQAYALAHQVNLIDLSGPEFNELRNAVERASHGIFTKFRSEGLFSRYYSFDRGGGPSRTKFLQSLRSTIRSRLWSDYQSEHDDRLPLDYEIYLDELYNSIENIGELFFGVSATGFLLILKADNPRVMLDHMHAERDPQIRVFWNELDPLSWTIEVRPQQDRSVRIPRCFLQFRLPENLLKSLDARGEEGRRVEALDLKQKHFSRITLYHITSEKTLTCSLKIDMERLIEAQAELRRRTV